MRPRMIATALVGLVLLAGCEAEEPQVVIDVVDAETVELPDVPPVAGCPDDASDGESCAFAGSCSEEAFDCCSCGCDYTLTCTCREGRWDCTTTFTDRCSSGCYGEDVPDPEDMYEPDPDAFDVDDAFEVDVLEPGDVLEPDDASEVDVAPPLPPCLTSADCAEGERCVGGPAVPRLCAPPFYFCPKGSDCRDGQCIPRPCSTHGDCAAIAYCVEGLCRPEPGGCTAP